MRAPETPTEQAVEKIDAIRRTIKGFSWETLTAGVPVTVSVGVAGVADAGKATQPALLSVADRHLYAAKHGGRDRVVWSRTRHGQASAA